MLSLSNTDADYEITAGVTPRYQSTALAAMKDVLVKTKPPDQAWDIMDQRRAELGLKDKTTKSLVSSMIMQALGGPLEAAYKFAKVSNDEAATYDHLLEALEAKPKKRLWRFSPNRDGKNSTSWMKCFAILGTITLPSQPTVWFFDCSTYCMVCGFLTSEDRITDCTKLQYVS